MYENLKLGDMGDNVKILQEKLKILGFYNALITGSFGLSTEEGVKAFQRENNFEETGVVTEKEWNLLFELTEPAVSTIRALPTLSLGSTGEDVKDLQTKLKALLYYTGSITGNFDLETENAVKRFQMNNDLTANGVVTTQTWNFINSYYGNLNSCAIDQEEDYITYTVQNGDTLYAIARRYKTTVDAIKNLNNLTNDTLNIGQVLKIPSMSTDTNYITYKVVSGDTLYAIARRYETTVDAIKSLNNLTTNTLTIGQILKIPTVSSSDNYFNYTVENGDTLYALARRYNTTVDAIKSLNNLTSNTLNIGQILKIPMTSDDNYINYVVMRGDTLYAIARRYNTTVDEIKRLNNLTSNTLVIGQVLTIRV